MDKLNELESRAKRLSSPTTGEASETMLVEVESVLAAVEAFREMHHRAEAAEAQLAELAKQPPVAWQCDAHGLMQTEDKEQATRWIKKGWKVWPLFTRPAPAADLAELVPSIEALRAEFEEVERKSDDGFNLHRYDTVYADDETQERWDLWLSCRAAILKNIEEAK